MAARRRDSARRTLPPNLYESGGYYTWRDPATGKRHGLGRDRQQAIAEAVEANLYIAGLLDQQRLVDRLQGEEDQSFAAWCDRYADILADRPLAKATRESFGQRLRIVREHFAGKALAKVTTKDIADLLKVWNDQGKKRMAQAVRSFLLDLFREAIAAGWIESNPVEPTRAPRIDVARARLTLDAFKAIHAKAADFSPWAQRSMELALVTAQRREDVASHGPRDVRDGRLWIAQQKTGARVCIPLSLRLDAVGWSVGDIIGRCRDSVVSRFFIHHDTHTGRAKPGDRLRLQTITAAFAEARDATEMTWPEGRTPPTFHEIRSLAARLYADRGIDPQALLGHKSPDMTAIYRDVRGAEWIEVKTA